MTHQNHQTNGASLEDCHTNFYALTDLCGIKWRKFVNCERPNASSDPLADPILRSYSRCMQADILCVWRRVQSTKPDNSDPNSLAFDITTSKVHPPLSLAAAKELWIFWYGEEPDLSELVDAELLRIAANQTLWNGTWKGELTYECRSLLFKALHNLMERFVLSKDIVRFGKWFVQPCTSSDRLFDRSSQHLSFSFTFFVHGDTVCASIDLREHPAVRPLTKEHLAEAAAAFAAATTPNQSQEQQNSTAAPAAKSPTDCNGTTGNDNGNADGVRSSNENATPPKPRKVILAPFGMAGILTGNSYKATDPMAEKILDDWASFFPLCNKDNTDVPPVVEVVSGGHKMYHPTNYVLVTDLDDMEDLEMSELHKRNINNHAAIAAVAAASASSSSEAAALATFSSAAAAVTGVATGAAAAATTQLPPVSVLRKAIMAGGGTINSNANDTNKTSSATTTPTKTATNNSVTSSAVSALERLSFQPYYDQRPTSGFTFNTSNTHIPPSAAVEMPERAWQDCITNPLHIGHIANSMAMSTNPTAGSGNDAIDESNNASSANGNGGTNSDDKNSLEVDSKQQVQQQIQQQQQQQNQQRQKLWSFVDPMQKAPCICTNSQISSNKKVSNYIFNMTNASTSGSGSLNSSGNISSVSMSTATIMTTSGGVGGNSSVIGGSATAAAVAAMRLGQVVGKTHCFSGVSVGGVGVGNSNSLQSSIFGSSHYGSHHLHHHHHHHQQQQQQQQHFRPSTPSNIHSVAESSSSSNNNNNNTTANIIANNNSGNSGNNKSSHASKRSIPFHKRFLDDLPSLTATTRLTSKATITTTTKSNQTKSSLGGLVAFYQTSTSSSTTDTIPKSRHLPAIGSTPHGTPHGGASTYSRNSIGDSIPVPSVGSPATPAPSPHPNSAHSQPTSVPPAEQLLQMSPHAPTSVSNLQQPPTPIDHLLDKNTPAPTPTDQHDSKSVTASPYVHPTPSVEPPPYNDSFHSGQQASGGPGSVPQPLSVGRCTPTIGQQQQQQQQQGTISVKKFELQQALTPLGAGGITEIKQEPGMNGNHFCGGVGGNPMANHELSAAGNAQTAQTLSSTEALNNYLKLYKPPKLTNKDADSYYDEDWLKDTIYDFSFQESWDYLPVKRHKPNELPRTRRPRHTKNLYEGHTHFKPLMPSPGSVYGPQLLIDANAAANSLRMDTQYNDGHNPSGGLVGIVGGGANMSGVQNGGDDTDGGLTNNYFQGLDIKSEPNTHSPCKESKSNSTGGNLYTAEGLNPSLNDLEQLFETSSNDECSSVQIHTPPDSNNPSNGGCSTVTNTIDELKRSTAVASAVAAAVGNAAIVALHNCGSGNSNNSNSGANTIQAEDLTKMFPTPPSHEQQHPNSSPCQMDIQMTDLSVITSTLETTVGIVPPMLSGLVGGGGVGGGAMMKIKQEYSVELGSPIEEPIDDWSYVYKPPQQEKFVGSSRYAPLTNLPSQTLPPLALPANCVYKPTWTTQKSRAAAAAKAAAAQQQQQQQHHQQQQQKQQQLQQQQQQQQQPQKHQQLHELLSAGPRTPLQQPRTPLGPMPSPMHNTVPLPLSSGGSNLLLNQLNCPQAALTNTPGGSMQHLMQRAGMSPISPASGTGGVPFPRGSPMLQHRQTPIHPPPPYELAVASPATSTSSYLNKQYNSQEHPHTPQSVGMANMHPGGGPHSMHGPGAQSVALYSGGVTSGSVSGNNAINELPEVSSVMVNILLYDTALNVFRDHNFDSSTVCVCNADTQKIGNIRGADSGVYVPLPGNSFNPSPNSASALAQHLIAGVNRNVRGGSAVGGGGNGSVGGGVSGGGMRMISAFGGVSALDSPASLPGAGSGHTGGSNSSSCTPPSSNQHITGYVDDDPVDCTCGFSAVVNRRLSHRAGLFYEDELEITGIVDDPARHKQPSLLSVINSLCRKNQTKNDTDKSNGQMEQLAYAIFDMLLDQCSIIQTNSSSVHRALQRHRRHLSRPQRLYGKSATVASIANVLEFVDANDIICLALEQSRLAFENQRMDITEFGQHSQLSGFHSAAVALRNKLLGVNNRLTVHKWPYIPVGFTRSNKEIVRTMNSIQPMLQNAFHLKSRSAAGSKDATYTVSGPLTWRQFHRLAGRASGQCEPQPIPSVIVGYDKDWISVSPHSIHYWDKFMLEPYSYARDIVYVVICPDNDYVINNTRTYFRELSGTYEMCKLGKHTPIRGWDGMLTVGCRPEHQTTPLDDWLRTLDNTQLAEQIRRYAVAFLHQLAPYLSRIPSDKTLLNPPDQNNSANGTTNGGIRSDRSNLTSPSGNGMTGDGEKLHNSPKLEPISNEQSNASNNEDTKPDLKSETKPTIVLGDPLGVGETLEDINPPAIILYVVNPFTFGTDAPELERLALIALLRCYAELMKQLPDSVRANMNIQIISLESIMELGPSGSRKRLSDEIKCLALNIFSQCRRHMVHAQSVKSLTGFGTAANMETFLKTKDEQNRRAYKMYTPPFVLAPIYERNDKTDFSRASAGMRGPNEQKYSVMYCNYCLSEDQSWLLATATDDRGEMLEKVCINIDVPNRARRRKAPARYIALTKLMDFIMGLISQTSQTWRIVIGRIGRIGHSELKSWSYLLSKQQLQKASKHFKDMCKQCTLMYPPTILSACLVTLEPDAKLRVMPDQFTPDERFSQISMQNPLSTPQDVTCTHILVFPTSAVCLSFTRQFPNEPQVEFESDFLTFGEEEENEGFSDADLGELFWDTQMDRVSNHGSPGRIEDNRSWQSAGGNNFKCSQPQDVEEVGSLNQQPLAVGYMVSTAPTGRMPAWFWSACPHLEDVCPVFLKTALHLHVPNIQTTDDILNSTNAHQSANDHPLDSTLTADVLRFVLEGYNALSWLALDSNTHDRLSCLPINVQTLMDLYYLTAAIV